MVEWALVIMSRVIEIGGWLDCERSLQSHKLILGLQKKASRAWSALLRWKSLVWIFAQKQEK